MLVGIGTATFAINLYAVLSVETPTTLQLIFWLASTLCFLWIAIGASSAIIGFFVLMFGRPATAPTSPTQTDARTALLFPVYSEDPGEVAATIRTMAADIAAEHCARFDIFILSDTQDEVRRAQEREIYGSVLAAIECPTRLYVRWRTPNTAKKAGNIAEWITTYGAAYRYFVILDADSIMSAKTLAALVAAMEREPELGLLQTVPRLVGAETTFARAQQFAAAYYGPLVASGIAAWQGDTGNYWGHNAIVRTEAFAAAAGLPELAGRPPFGGHILSHDFVEAALLVRAGWRVRLLPHVEGSFEGCPPGLTDLLVRDRRWAQGNLQHLRIVSAARLAPTSRLHLVLGAWSYLASAIWAVTLIVGVVLAFEAKFADPKYFGSEISLFPKWPVFDAQKALALFAATIVVVHLPKILGLVWAARSRESRTAHGGVLRLVTGALVESVLATVVAPILMVSQTSAVLAIMLGRDAGWGAQRRAADRGTVEWYRRRYRWHTAWGVATAVVCATVSWQVLAWMSPVIVGLVASAPIAMLTARHAPDWLASLLATVEDMHPPALLVARAQQRQPPRRR